ncbi:MAG: GHKL domain-containing protein [Halobacteriovoraceae bacterium]|nr:GHKL domain-containing protein [Halobacteriovoraceae bacterium]MCB9095321.1 GHKL domain-containing protein [Halobacteriovoraceae bacterium]
MSHLEQKRFFIFILSILGAFIVSSSLYTFAEYRSIEKIKKNWKVYIDNVDKKIRLLSLLKEEMGYGGLIHNFKNYLLRDQEVYKRKFEINAKNSYEIIETIKNLTSTVHEELRELDHIQKTIKTYENKIIQLKSIKKTKEIRSLDSLVKVDDSQALRAFRWFDEYLRNLKFESIAKLDRDVSNALQGLVFAVVMSALVFILTLFYGSRKILAIQKSLEKVDEEKNQFARLSAIGQMAGSIAHEINNPLAILNGNAAVITKLLEREQISREQVKENCENIQKTVMRIASVTRGLRNLTRDINENEIENFKVDDLLEEVVSLSQDRFKNQNIMFFVKNSLRTEISGQRVLIGQVLINLLNNSFDAIKDQEDKWVRIETSLKNDMVVIAVTDSGSGIPEEVRKNLMLPFFTTKKTGDGTGMGLSLSKNIAEKHHGKLYFDEKSENTCFVLELPYMTKKLKKIA